MEGALCEARVWIFFPEGKPPCRLLNRNLFFFQVHTLSGHFLFVKCVAFSLDSKRVVSASFDQLVKIWNAETGAEVRPLIMVDDNLHSIPFYYSSRLFSATR